MQPIAEGVWRAERGLVRIGRPEVLMLEDAAVATAKMRARILAHQPEDSVHYMVIAFSKGSWNDWHSHAKNESVVVLSGALQVRLRGQAEVNLTPGEFLLIPGGLEHQPIPLSDTVILEIAEK